MENNLHGDLERIFREVFEDQKLTLKDEMTARDVEKWDSLTHVALVVAVEEFFHVKFRNAEIARLKCVGDLKKLVTKYNKMS